MKQEQKLVAEAYRYLAPFIDTSKELYISLDGQAAQIGLKRGHFIDGTIPDLWFTLVGASGPILIEAKCLDPKGRLLLMQSQLRAWRSGGKGRHQPHCWIAASNTFDAFYLWQHSAFLSLLDRSTNTQKTVSLGTPAEKMRYKSVAELALAILVTALNHRDNGAHSGSLVARLVGMTAHSSGAG